MAWHNFFITPKKDAQENNYKLELFQSISNNAKNEILGYSTIKKYFNSLYDYGNGAFSSFSVDQTLNNAYGAEATDKARTSCTISSNVNV